MIHVESMTASQTHILAKIKAAVNAVDSSAEVILYGSRARNTEHAESDWDLLILTNGSVGLRDEQKFRHKLFELELELGEAFSTKVLSRSTWEQRKNIIPLLKNIRKEGVQI
jgi:predicted nucleotidyltransferase